MVSSSPKPAEEPSNTNRLTAADCFAEIVEGEGPGGGAVFHWIVQRVGNPEILMWGQEATHDAACAAAKSYLQTFVRTDVQSA